MEPALPDLSAKVHNWPSELWKPKYTWKGRPRLIGENELPEHQGYVHNSKCNL